MIISAYPRSGSSWITRIIASSSNAYLTNEDRVFNNYWNNRKLKKRITFLKSFFFYKKDKLLNRSVPTINFIKKGHFSSFEEMQKSHWNLDNSFVYIYRDPRDVMISYFFFINSRKNNRNFNSIPKSELLEFINNNVDDWKRYMDSWMESPSCKVAYESFLKEPLQEAKRIYTEIGVPYKHESLLKSIEKWSVSSYREHLKEENLSPEKRMIRKAQSGDWKNYFDDEMKYKIKQHLNDYLVQLSYERDTNW